MPIRRTASTRRRFQRRSVSSSRRVRSTSDGVMIEFKRAAVDRRRRLRRRESSSVLRDRKKRALIGLGRRIMTEVGRIRTQFGTERERQARERRERQRPPRGTILI